MSIAHPHNKYVTRIINKCKFYIQLYITLCTRKLSVHYCYQSKVKVASIAYQALGSAKELICIDSVLD